MGNRCVSRDRVRLPGRDTTSAPDYPSATRAAEDGFSFQSDGAHVVFPVPGLTLQDVAPPVSGVDPVDRLARSCAGPVAARPAGVVADRGVAGRLAVADDRPQCGQTMIWRSVLRTSTSRPNSAPTWPVWLAGYYPGRAATGVHDPLFARCVVLKSGVQKIAWVSVDLIGLQFPAVQELRKRLTDFHYVLVASTHNHEGPDVIGVWGQSFLHRGVNDDYLALVVTAWNRPCVGPSSICGRAGVLGDGGRRVLAARQPPADRQRRRAAVAAIYRSARTRHGGSGRAMELPSRGVGCRTTR